MSRLDEALKRAGAASTAPESINIPSAHALDWFPSAESSESADAVASASVCHDDVSAQLAQKVAASRLKATSRVHAASTGSRLTADYFEQAPPHSRSINAAAPISQERPPSPAIQTQGRLFGSPHMPSSAAEQYRRIAATLHHSQGSQDIRVVMVASAISGEGKTLTATNLALTLGESYKREVLLIDADLRRPMVHAVLGISGGGGLNAVLRAADDCRLGIVPCTANVSVLTAGEPDPDPMSSLTSERMRRVIAEARERFDWVIIDTPPLALLADANLLGGMVDAAVLVVAAGRTPAKAVQQAVTAIGRERIVGVVLNRVPAETLAGNYASSYCYNVGNERDHGKRLT
jgi:capsular exopolysaccharide synthesis family protein